MAKIPFTRLCSGILALALAISLLYLTFANQRQNKFDNNKIRVLASLRCWGSLAEQIGGNKVSVISLINQTNQDAHDYEPSAFDSLAVQNAQLIIINGSGYDEFLNRLISSTNTMAEKLNLSISAKEKINQNPHLWFDALDLPIFGKQILNQLSKIDSKDQAYFQNQYQVFLSDLRPLQDKIKLLGKKFIKLPIAYTERLPQYLTNDLGWFNQTPFNFSSSVENNSDISPQDFAQMQDLIQHKQIKMLIYNTQTQNSITNQIKELAKQKQIPVIGLTEVMPRQFNNLIAWNLSVLTNMQNSLNS